jgi:putative ABC transport system permease protein
LLWAVLAGAVVLAVLCGVLGWMLLNVLKGLTIKSLPVRLAVNRLLRQPWSTLSQLSAFSLSFMLLALCWCCAAICWTAGNSSFRLKARTIS